MQNWHKFAAALFVSALFALLVAAAGPTTSSAEPATVQTSQGRPPVVMVALPWDDPSIRIPPPQQAEAADAPTASFIVHYLPAGTPDGAGSTCLAWDSPAQAAFTYATSIWATKIASPVPIEIDACWANLGSPSILGYSWADAIRDFPGAPLPGTWYDYALADALAGTNLDPGLSDIHITYNNGFSWYFGTNGQTPGGQYDFVSVVMHEMGHGLNFSGSMSYGSTNCNGANYGCWGYGTGYPAIYDRFTENAAGAALLNTSLFPNGSAALGAQLTGNAVYFDGPLANAANGGNRVKLYAPTAWAQGSSYSHLDYSTFAGTPNQLMVYAISAASSIHDPGPVTMGMLQDMGWNPAVGNPVPVITGLGQRTVAPGGPGFDLTVNGAGFVITSTVRLNGSERATTYVSPTQLTAAITAADIATPGTASVTVFSPPPGGGTSNAVTLLVAHQVYLPRISKTLPPPPSWTTLVSTDFEGEWPGPWKVGDNNGSAYGTYFWGRRNCRPFAGGNSGWAVGAGSNLSCGSSYPDGADSWMVFGPFNLQDATAAELRFKVWANTEYGYDKFYWTASTNGSNYSGWVGSGNTGGWIEESLDLVGELGQPNVWVALVFRSDADIHYAEGVYVDNVVVRKCPSGAVCPSGSASEVPAGSQFAQFPAELVRPE